MFIRLRRSIRLRYIRLRFKRLGFNNPKRFGRLRFNSPRRSMRLRFMVQLCVTLRIIPASPFIYIYTSLYVMSWSCLNLSTF